MGHRHVVNLEGGGVATVSVIATSPTTFVVFHDHPGDLHIQYSSEVQRISCKHCRDVHGFFCRGVVYDELWDRFTASSYEQLYDAFRHLTFSVCKD